VRVRVPPSAPKLLNRRYAAGIPKGERFHVRLIIVAALAHRYWEYPAAQQLNRYNHFPKNVALVAQGPCRSSPVPAAIRSTR
jgi:hypothetical protein